MNLRTTKVFEELLEAWKGRKRRCLLEGGTSSSKTYSMLQFLIYIAEKAPKPTLISLVSESLPHLKRGMIRDFFNILGESADHNPYYSKTEFTYKRPEWKGAFEFFGADDASKVRGPRRQILAINEGNNIPWETARGLDIRTSMFTIVDWNPVGRFWAHEHWIDTDEVPHPENAYSHSTYLDAKDVIPGQLVQDIEAYRNTDPNWWRIYGLGLEGKITGLVYPNFEQVDELPMGAVFYGLDYGFSADPTVLVKNVVVGDKLYSQQMFYDYSGLTNGQIAQRFGLLGIRNEPIYPDPDEPKSAEELRQLGYNVRQAVMGRGSVDFGQQKVNNYYQYWTKDSLECIEEQRNFRFIVDKVTELFTDRTTHRWSHGMAARRYAASSHMSQAGRAPVTKKAAMRFGG